MSVDPDGTVHVADVSIPMSALLSEEARRRAADYLLWRKSLPPLDFPEAASLDEKILIWRAVADAEKVPLVAALRERYAVDMVPEMIGGVQTDVVTPTGGVEERNRERVLINLHGGGFIWGGRGEGQAFSIPIAATAGITVVTVDYRMAPEHRHPAASEDVAAVYSALLADYPPENIGIYGHSAGGALASLAVAWFQRVGLPRPGAIGVIQAGLNEVLGGDSHYLAAVFAGASPTPVSPRDESFFAQVFSRYLAGADVDDPWTSPVRHPDALRLFPPTLVLNSIRDPTLSHAVHAHIQLVKAGVPAELYVWEGLGHDFLLFQSDTPEAQEAFEVVAGFFDRHLARDARP